MKLGNTALVVAGVAVAAVAAYYVATRQTNPPAKYVLTFKNVKLTNVDEFKNALAAAQQRGEWNSQLTFAGPDPTPSPYPAASALSTLPVPKLVGQLDFTEANQTPSLDNPNSMHVTQRVGLYMNQDLNAVLNTITSQ